MALFIDGANLYATARFRYRLQASPERVSAAELRRQADIFLDIVELQPKIGRDPAERAAREAREPRDRHTPQFLQRPTAPARCSMTTTISKTERCDPPTRPGARVRQLSRLRRDDPNLRMAESKIALSL
jgi:hypothetical protein